MLQLAVLEVPRIAWRVPVDGDLNKSPWRDLAPIPLAASHGRDPGNAGRSVQETALRLCHDGERLYVAFACADRDAWGTYEGRNHPIYEEEVVEAFLAPGRDPRRYFELESSPRGAYWEGIIDNPDGRRETMRSDLDWVCEGWERAVRVHARPGDEGWSAEWAIPFEALAAGPARSGDRWRANFYRIERPRDGPPELSAWAPTHAEPAEFHRPHCFGVLVLA